MSTSSRGMYCTAGNNASLSVSARVVSATKRPANVTRTLLGFGVIVMGWSGLGNHIAEFLVANCAHPCRYGDKGASSRGP
jgi:hypothetical protein